MKVTDEDARALSVRQPWAWAIISGYKDIENRSKGFGKVIAPRALGKTIFIHASKYFARANYDEAVKEIRRLGIECPPHHNLQFGGIIGTVMIADIVWRSPSRWFHGPCGLVVKNPLPCRFVPAKGQVGLFGVNKALLL
jgi:hypothetical protein